MDVTWTVFLIASLIFLIDLKMSNPLNRCVLLLIVTAPQAMYITKQRLVLKGKISNNIFLIRRYRLWNITNFGTDRDLYDKNGT
jgi:hypothetical protein